MRRIPFLVASLLALAAAPLAAAQNEPGGAASTSRVVLVAPLHNATTFNAGPVQLAFGPERTQYTLDIGPGLAIYDAAGRRLPSNQVAKGAWVRAAGTPGADPRSLRVTSLQVIGAGPEAEQSAFYRRNYPTGYVMTIGGTREVFPAGGDLRMSVEPTILVGRVAAAPNAGARRAWSPVRTSGTSRSWRTRRS
jgi:hypothetical protein